MDMVFIKVLNMSISASWLVLVVLALRQVLKKLPRWVHVCLWALVAVRLVCPFSVESGLSLNPAELTSKIVEEIPNSYIGPSSSYWDHMPEYEEAVEAGAEPIYGGEGHYYVITGKDHLTPVMTTQQIQSWIWLGGVGALLLYAMVSFLRLKRKVEVSIQLDNDICICDYIDTPFILGIIRPQIYLPSSMAPDSASHVLAHERAHIARRDHWWKPLGYLLLTVHWFNPLMWLAYVLLCRDIELACDEKVIRQMKMPQKKAYSEALLNCSVKRMHIAACPLAFGEVGVKQRVQSVLNYRKPTFWLVLTAVLALIITAVCFLTDPVARFDQEAADYLEEYAFEQVNGRMKREDVVCIDAREGFSLVYCRGQGSVLNLYQYEKTGNQIKVVSHCSGDYAISGGMSLNHVVSGETHIYFGTISQYHYNPRADVNTWLNWNHLTLTDETGKSHKQDMTAKEGFLFILDAPMKDFQAVDGLDTVCLDLDKFLEQGYTVREVSLPDWDSVDDPFSEGESPYQWTLNLRREHVQLMQITVYDEDGVPQHIVLGESEQIRLLRILNSLTEDQITLGRLKNDHVVSACVQCMDENGWNADLDVLLQYDGSAVRMGFSTAGAERYPERKSQDWIIRSDDLNAFLSVYIYKQPEQDPFSNPDNAFNWCRNIRLTYLDQSYILAKDATGTYMGEATQLQTQELLRILNQLPESAFEKAEFPEEFDIEVNLICRNVWNGDTPDPMVDLQLLNGEVYFTLGTDWQQPYQTWKISSHALAEFMDGLIDKGKTLWQQLPMTGAVWRRAESHGYVSCKQGDLEMFVPELECFVYEVSEIGIRFKPENVEGWILVQYRTEPFAVCGTGLETSEVMYKNGKYTGIQGWFDGNEAWSFLDLTATSGDVAYNVVFLNEENALWVTEYGYEITEVINELSFQVTG